MLNFFRKRFTKSAAESCCTVNIRETKSEEKDMCCDSERLGEDKDTGRIRASQDNTE